MNADLNQFVRESLLRGVPREAIRSTLAEAGWRPEECIGTQPLGTLAIGLLAAAIGAPLTFTVNAFAALVVIVPLAVPLVRR